MPIGCCSIVPWLVTALHQQQPGRILDQGIGMGFYGAVVRQWLDHGVRPWRTRLVGIEGFADYDNPCWDLYDEVIVVPIQAGLPVLESQWDAILLLDVLEHFERSEGERLLQLARAKLAADGRLYVATPAVRMEQGAAYGNELERHRSLWTADDLEGLGFQLLWPGTTDIHGHAMLLGVAEPLC